MRQRRLVPESWMIYSWWAAHMHKESFFVYYFSQMSIIMNRLYNSMRIIDIACCRKKLFTASMRNCEYYWNQDRHYDDHYSRISSSINLRELGSNTVVHMLDDMERIRIVRLVCHSVCGKKMKHDVDENDKIVLLCRLLEFQKPFICIVHTQRRIRAQHM